MRNIWSNVAQFWQDEDGAVTVDWVVLTAAIVGLGIATIAAVSDGSLTLSGAISTAVAEAELLD